MLQNRVTPPESFSRYLDQVDLQLFHTWIALVYHALPTVRSTENNINQFSLISQLSIIKIAFFFSWGWDWLKKKPVFPDHYELIELKYLAANSTITTNVLILPLLLVYHYPTPPLIYFTLPCCGTIYLEVLIWHGKSHKNTLNAYILTANIMLSIKLHVNHVSLNWTKNWWGGWSAARPDRSTTYICIKGVPDAIHVLCPWPTPATVPPS